MKRALTSAALAILWLVTLLPTAHSAEEFRGLFVDAFHPGLLNHEQVTQMVKSAKQANFNALFVQVRKRGDTLYNSKIEPKFTGVAEGYDPLADVITQAHAAGLEVHAWLTVYEVSHSSYTPAATHVCKAHTDWLMPDKDGKTVHAKGRIYVDPGLTTVQDHIVSIVREILANYAVDGIMLENPHYPEKNLGYNTASVSAFNQKYSKSGKPEAGDPDWATWRSAQITTLMRKVHEVMSTKPEVTLGVNVSSDDPKLANSVFMQDWGTWTAEQLVDYVVPLLFLKVDRMSGFAKEAMKNKSPREVYIGVGAYQLSMDMLQKHIQDARTAGAKGVVLYNYHYLRVGPDGAESTKMKDLAGTVFAEPAGVPTLPWKR